MQQIAPAAAMLGSPKVCAPVLRSPAHARLHFMILHAHPSRVPAQVCRAAAGGLPGLRSAAAGPLEQQISWRQVTSRGRAAGGSACAKASRSISGSSRAGWRRWPSCRASCGVRERAEEGPRARRRETVRPPARRGGAEPAPERAADRGHSSQATSDLDRRSTSREPSPGAAKRMHVRCTFLQSCACFYLACHGIAVADYALLRQ